MYKITQDNELMMKHLRVKLNIDIYYKQSVYKLLAVKDTN